MNKKEKIEEVYKELVLSVKKELEKDNLRNKKSFEESLKKIGVKIGEYNLTALVVDNIRLEQELNKEITNKMIDEFFYDKWKEIDKLLEDIKILLNDECR